MTQIKLDKLIEEKIKQKANEDRYHKRGQLLDLTPSLHKMLDANLSIKEQVELLAEVGIKISDKSYRDFLMREFGEEYDQFLERNGWVRKKRKKAE